MLATRKAGMIWYYPSLLTPAHPHPQTVPILLLLFYLILDAGSTQIKQ